jgi:protein O-mannosyl-transferase
MRDARQGHSEERIAMRQRRVTANERRNERGSSRRARSEKNDAASRRWQDGLVAAFLAILTIATYGNGLRNGFVWDDERLIVNNPATQDLAQLGRVLLSPDEVAPYYRPLNRASYLFDHALFGMNPTGFHGVNILLHAAAVALLYALARRVDSGHRLAAVAAAALLAVHPINTEAVDFITARNNLFALVFSLAALWLYLVAWGNTRLAWAWASGGALFLALLSKEQGGMTLGVIAAVSALAPAIGLDKRPARWVVRSWAPHAAAAAIYVGMRVVSLRGAAAGPAATSPDLGARLLLDLAIVPRYAQLLAFPRDLTVFHDVGPTAWASWTVLFTWAGLAAIGALVWRHRDALVVAGCTWLVFHALPAANLVAIPSSPMAERYLYVPAAGLWLVVGSIFARVLAPRLGQAAIPAGVLVIAALSMRAGLRNADWKNDVTLFRAAVATSPGSATARFNLGNSLRDDGDLAGARREWEAAVRIEPQHAQSLVQLGTLAAVNGELPQAEVLLRRALASTSPPSLARFNLARICELTGRAAEATVLYEDFLRADDPLYREYREPAMQRLAALKSRR